MRRKNNRSEVGLEMPDFGELVGNTVSLESSLAEMQAAGHVTPEIDPVLERLIQFTSKQEQFWSNSSPSPSDFAVYHSWRNLRLIFSKMRTRFADAPKIHDNPLVVDHARQILPNILSAIASLVSLESDPTKLNTQQVMKQIRQLRLAARRSKMIEPDEELKEVAHDKLLEAFDELLKPMASDEA